MKLHLRPAQSKSIPWPTYKYAKFFTLGLCQNKMESTDIRRKGPNIKYQQALQSHLLQQSSKVILLFICTYKIPWSVQSFERGLHSTVFPNTGQFLLCSQPEAGYSLFTFLTPSIPSACKFTCVPEKYQEMLTPQKMSRLYIVCTSLLSKICQIISQITCGAGW